MSTATMLPVLAITLLIAAASTSNAVVDPQTISQICSKTRDPAFCFDYFKDDGFVALSDLKYAEKTILDRTIGITRINGEDGIAPIAARTVDPALKQQLNECVRCYGDAVVNLGKAKQSLEANDPKGVNNNVLAAQTSVAGCRVQFYNVPSFNTEEYNYMSMLLVISNML